MKKVRFQKGGKVYFDDGSSENARQYFTGQSKEKKTFVKKFDADKNRKFDADKNRSLKFSDNKKNENKN